MKIIKVAKKAKIIKIASMDVMVADFNYPRQMNHLLDSTFYLRDKLFYDFLSKEEQQQYIADRPHELFGVDGDSDYSSKEGTINFYSHNFPRKEQALQAIKYFAKENESDVVSITGPERAGQPSEVYRINYVMYPQKQKNEPPRLNMANGNARAIFSGLLNYSDDGWGYSMDAWELVQRIDKVINAQIEEHSQEPSQEGNFIDMGRSQDYLKMRLQDVRKVAQWAIDNGYRKISVG